MNGHFPLTVMTRFEIQSMMAIGEQMISYQFGNPMVGSFQDTLVGGALFTFTGQQFDKFHTMQMFAGIDEMVDGGMVFDKKVYSNYDILSMILPNINFSGKPAMYNEAYAPFIKYKKEDIKVHIDSGKYMGGIMDKKTVGQSTSGSLAHIIKNQYGSKSALDFTFNTQQIVTNYLMHRGFSLSIKDMLISKKALEDVHQKTSAILMDSDRVTERLNDGEIIPPIGLTTEEFYEETQMSVLSVTDDYTQTIISDINTESNQLYQLIASGSKGNNQNLLAISSAVGQMLIGGKRISSNFGYNRTLPYSHHLIQIQKQRVHPR